MQTVWQLARELAHHHSDPTCSLLASRQQVSIPLSVCLFVCVYDGGREVPRHSNGSGVMQGCDILAMRWSDENCMATQSAAVKRQYALDLLSSKEVAVTRVKTCDSNVAKSCR